MRTFCILWLLSMATLPAHALGRLADVQLLDRDTGALLPVHYYRAQYWVAGTPGDRYSIQIRNRASGRVLAVTSVDGINVISGESAAWGQTGYVFDARQAYGIDGWRKSDEQVADFVFTSVPRSYAARTGRAQNVGIIGVALFLERPAPTVSNFGEPLRSQAASAGTDARAASADSVAPAAAAPSLGTGHGEREYSSVVDTAFERLSEQPSELLQIRYDSVENLVALGVIGRPPAPPPSPDPFPRSTAHSYVPDPPG